MLFCIFWFFVFFFFFSSRRRHTRCGRDWSSDVCSSDLKVVLKISLPRSLTSGLPLNTTITTNRCTTWFNSTAFGDEVNSCTIGYWVTPHVISYYRDVNNRTVNIVGRWIENIRRYLKPILLWQACGYCER